MKINFSDMTKMIVKEVVRQMTPTIRKIVREEVVRGTRRIIKENKAIVNDLSVRPAATPALTEDMIDDSAAGLAKEALAKRAHARANKILTNSFAEDDPYASLIMDAEDPEMIKQAEERQFDNLPMVEVTDPSMKSAQPEQIDYTAMMEKMGI